MVTLILLRTAQVADVDIMNKHNGLCISICRNCCNYVMFGNSGYVVSKYLIILGYPGLGLRSSPLRFIKIMLPNVALVK
jgi:hypothetical protein